MAQIIHTAQTEITMRRHGGYRRAVERFSDVTARNADIASPTIDWNKVKGSIFAYVNHGRWVAECPHCYSALIVTPDEPFFCAECFNAGSGGALFEVVFPDEKPEIEALLLLRPLIKGLPITRNWLLGETLDMLRAENIVNGV